MFCLLCIKSYLIATQMMTFSQLGGIIKVLFSALSVILSLELFSDKFDDKGQKKLELLKKNHRG